MTRRQRVLLTTEAQIIFILMYDHRPSHNVFNCHIGQCVGVRTRAIDITEITRVTFTLPTRWTTMFLWRSLLIVIAGLEAAITSHVAGAVNMETVFSRWQSLELSLDVEACLAITECDSTLDGRSVEDSDSGRSHYICILEWIA